jgi:ATP-dependent Lon protease
LNTKLREIFRGRAVNKALTLNTGVDEFPRYVLEYLIDNYCSEETFHQDMEKVVRRLKENFVHGAEAEKIRHFIRENRRHSIIANLEVRLVETEDKYWATIGAINESLVNIPESIVRQYPMLLSGGMWGTIDLTYDEEAEHVVLAVIGRVEQALERVPELAKSKAQQGKQAEAARARSTDAEATVMKRGDGGYRPAYHAY